MTTVRKIALLVVFAMTLLGGFVAGAQDQPAPILLTAADLTWADGPLPGAKSVVLEGNPKEAGPFTMRLKLPADYKIPPHSHPADERVTVISGTFNVARGEKFDSTKGATTLPAGGFMLMPPKTSHFAWVKEETVIQINGVGPWALNFVNPADDPRKK